MEVLTRPNVHVTTPYDGLWTQTHNKEQLLLLARHKAKPLVFITDRSLFNKRYHGDQIRQRHVRPSSIVLLTFSTTDRTSYCHRTVIILPLSFPQWRRHYYCQYSQWNCPLRLLIIIRSRRSSAGTHISISYMHSAMGGGAMPLNQ